MTPCSQCLFVRWSSVPNADALLRRCCQNMSLTVREPSAGLALFNITPHTSHPTRLTISNAFTTLTRCKAQLLQTIHMHSQSSAATNALPLEYVGRYAPDKRDQENRGPCCQKTKKGKTPKSMQDAIRESRTPYPIRSVIRQTDQPEPDAAL